jgi:hypothetical protein
MSFSFTGKAAWVALAICAAVVVAIIIKPEILSWVLGALYSGPR